MSQLKLPTKAGAVVVALGGITATLTVEDAREWLELISQYGPLVLSAWLMYVAYKLDRERNELKFELSELRVKVAKLERDARHNAY